MNNLWFLWITFLCSITMYILQRCIKNKGICFLGVCIISMILPNDGLCFYYSFMLPFFATGYFISGISNRKIVKSINKNKLVLCLIIFTSIFLLMLSGFNLEHYVYTSKMCIFTSEYGIIGQLAINLYRFSIGELGIISIFLWVYSIDLFCGNLIIIKKLKFVLNKIGKETLCIYACSIYINLKVLVKITKNFCYDINIVIIETIIIVLITYVISKIIGKVTVLRKTFLGRSA